MSGVRTRFAPSPTGSLHVGSARTALFNWAYARHRGGEWLLRIEDTDRERSTEASEAAVIEGLRWLGLEWDEGPYRQSEHHVRHAAAIEELLARGRAYRCRCSAAELEERKQETIAAGGKWTYDGRCRDLGLGPDCGPHTVRLRMPAGEPLAWDDGVFGPTAQDPAEIGDPIIRRSDGHPLYNLAVVVDDLDMRISHVIRGADHHINSALQIAIYRALDREPPRFAHVPLIVGESGQKLSKRRDSASIQAFRDQGYLPEAVCNWLARIGWSHGDQEVFSLDEIGRLFDLDAVSRSSARADEAKLQWLNQQYIVGMPGDALMGRLLPFLEEVAGGPVRVTPRLEQLVDLLRERGKTLREIAERARFALVDEVTYDEKAVRKHLKAEARAPLEDLRERLESLEDWSEAALEKVFEDVRARHDELPMGKLAQPVRVAVTGSAASPGIFETLAVLGRERAVRRIGAALALIDAA